MRVTTRTLSKKHYEAIADIVFLQLKKYQYHYNEYGNGYMEACVDIANELADYFEERNSKTNPNFDKEKFLKDCGVK